MVADPTATARLATRIRLALAEITMTAMDLVTTIRTAAPTAMTTPTEARRVVTRPLVRSLRRPAMFSTTTSSATRDVPRERVLAMVTMTIKQLANSPSNRIGRVVG